jgi:hypothetical protein
MIAILSVTSVVSGFNGSVEMIGEIRVVNLWGTWEEMGYAHGRLLGPDIKEVFEGYFLELAGGTSNVNLLRAYFPQYFSVPVEFTDYAEGIIEGMADTVSLWSDVYGRNLDVLDLCISSSVPDLSAVVDLPHLLCSSVSAWGDATANDPTLLGSPATSRNLDFFVDSQSGILDQSILVVHDPDGGQEWISVTFPGYMGTLSGMNETGLTATLNMGNHQGTFQTATPFVPICMALALGLSRPDFDGSGQCDIQDMTAAATVWNRGNSYDIHIVSPEALGTGDGPGVIAEVNNQNGTALRHSSDESTIAPDRMILTNHHRVLYPPITCYRYSRLLDSLTTSPDVTLDRLWNFMEAVGFQPVPGSGGTLHTMILQPQQRRIGLAFASPGMASYSKTPEWIQWSDLFPNHGQQSAPGDPGHYGFRVYPNPASAVIHVTDGTERQTPPVLYDMAGRRTGTRFTEANGVFSADVSGLATGLYVVVPEPGLPGCAFLVLK